MKAGWCKMILVFDVGNTNTVLGVFKNRTLVEHWRISTVRHRTADEYGMLLKNLFTSSGIMISDIKALLISSVVPPPAIA